MNYCHLNNKTKAFHREKEPVTSISYLRVFGFPWESHCWWGSFQVFKIYVLLDKPSREITVCVCVSLPYNPHCLAFSSQECTLEPFNINPAHRKQQHISTKDHHGTPQHFANSRSETFLSKFLAHPISLGSCIEGKLPGHRFLSLFVFFKKMCQVVI